MDQVTLLKELVQQLHNLVPAQQSVVLVDKRPPLPGGSDQANLHTCSALSLHRPNAEIHFRSYWPK